MKRFSGARRVTYFAAAFFVAGVVRGQNQTTAFLNIGPTDLAATVTSAGTGTGGMGVYGAFLAASSGLGPADDSGTAPPPLAAPGYYNTDLNNPTSGPVITAAQHHPIYVNQPPGYWGDVGTFLGDLGKSQFIHQLDQYVGAMRTTDTRWETFSSGRSRFLHRTTP